MSLELWMLVIIIATSIWTWFDAKERNLSTAWALGVLLLWIICFPLYLLSRAGRVPNAPAAPAPPVEIKKPGPAKAAVVVAVIIGGGLYVMWLLQGGGGSSTGSTGDSFLRSTAPVPEVTLAEYNAIQTGASYETAVRSIGTLGSEVSRTDLMGTRTIMYMWQNADGSNMNAMFQNGHLISKAQFGLK